MKGGTILSAAVNIDFYLVHLLFSQIGVDAAPLLAMQNEYDMLMAERNESFMKKLKCICRIAAVL